eukprot:1156863-Pelagomonas_calceolata.AAC.2
MTPPNGPHQRELPGELMLYYWPELLTSGAFPSVTQKQQNSTPLDIRCTSPHVGGPVVADMLYNRVCLAMINTFSIVTEPEEAVMQEASGGKAGEAVEADKVKEAGCRQA